MTTAMYVVWVIAIVTQLGHCVIHRYGRVFGINQFALGPAQSVKHSVTFFMKESVGSALYAQVAFPPVSGGHQCYGTIVIALNATAGHNGIIALIPEHFFIIDCLAGLTAASDKRVYIISDDMQGHTINPLGIQENHVWSKHVHIQTHSLTGQNTSGLSKHLGYRDTRRDGGPPT